MIHSWNLSTSVIGSSIGLKVERVNGFAPSSQRWQRRILLLNHTRVLEPVRGSAPRYQTYKARASLTMLNRQEMVLRVEVPSTTCRLGGGRSMYLSYRSKSRIDCLFRLNVPKAVKWYSWLGYRQQPFAHPARILELHYGSVKATDKNFGRGVIITGDNPFGSTRRKRLRCLPTASSCGNVSFG